MERKKLTLTDIQMMKQQGDGAIVNISSTASIRYTGYPSVPYNASKGAINQLTQNIAIQYAAKASVPIAFCRAW